jgi:CarboxypepD_reg-like domain
MKATTIIDIPSPCHENWDTMSPNEKGKYCHSCHKIVIDFSAMTDNEIIKHFNSKASNICGRFNENQLQRSLTPLPIVKKYTWQTIAASAISCIVGLKANTQLPIIKGKFKLNDTIVKTAVYDSLPNIISGKVVDKNGHPIAGASVSVFRTKIGVVTKVDGSFILKFKNIDQKSLEIKAIGYANKKVDIANNLCIELIEEFKTLKDVIIQIPYGTQKVRTYSGGAISIHSSNKKRKNIIQKVVEPIVVTYQKITNTQPIKIFPNPAHINMPISVYFKKPGAYNLYVLNNIQQLVFKQKIVTETENQTIKIYLPQTVASGFYLVNIIKEKTDFRFSEKLIIE